MLTRIATLLCVCFYLSHSACAADKNLPAIVDFEGLNSPVALDKFTPPTLVLISKADAAKLVVSFKSGGIMTVVDANGAAQDSTVTTFTDVKMGGLQKIPLPIKMGAGDTGTLTITIEQQDSAGKVLKSMSVDFNGYSVDGKLYYGLKSTVSLQQIYIMDLEKDGKITPEESLKRREELTTIRLKASELSVPAQQDGASKLAITNAITISGKVRWKDHTAQGGGGQSWPVLGLNVSVLDQAKPGTTIVTAVTDLTGGYSLTIPGNTITFNTASLSIFTTTSCTSFAVRTEAGNAYSVAITIPVNTSSAAITQNIDFDDIANANVNTRNAFRAWAVYSASWLLTQFCKDNAEFSNGFVTPRTIYFPTSGSTSHFDSSDKSMNILSKDYADFDVQFHEFGHLLNNIYGVVNKAGGDHSYQEMIHYTYATTDINGNPVNVTRTKDNALNLTWSEGLATCIDGMVCTYLVDKVGRNLAPRIEDQNYDDTEDVNMSDPFETTLNAVPHTEGNEDTIIHILYDLFDGGAGEDFDKVSLGANGLYSSIKASGAKKLGEYWLYLMNGALTPNNTTALTSLDPLKLQQYSPLFTENGLCPKPLSPKNKAELDAQVGATVKFTFLQNINKYDILKFRVLFLTADGKVLKTSDEDSSDLTAGAVANQRDINVPRALLSDAVTAAAGKPLFWTIAGIGSNAPVTGVYVGPLLPLDATANLILCVDDTGSMSDDIAGVRDGLLALLNGIDPKATGLTYQLITFKDDVSPRAPTTDLAVIKDQVSALYASGGGDLPEASVEALWFASAELAAGSAGGTVYLVTDAPPHAGLSIPATVAAMRSSGIRVNVLLTGSGYAADLPIQSPTDNHAIDGTYGYNPGPPIDLKSLIPDTATDTSGSSASLVELWGRVADGTGGVLVTAPKSDSTSISAATLNLTSSAIYPSLVLATPYSIPAGATLDVLIQGQNTSFGSSTTLQFSQTITVNTITVNSPTVLVANITIPSATPVGNVDVTATTGAEKATGKKLLKITAATTTPTILTVSPFVSSVGTTATVTIEGLNTTFTSTSKASFSGTGITVNSVTFTSATSLSANITIDPTAAGGYRDVTVDTVTKTNAIRVSTSSLAPLPSVSIAAPATITRGTTADLTLNGTNTTFDATTTVAFSGLNWKVNTVTLNSATQLKVNLTVDASAIPGYRDVFVNTGGGIVAGLAALQITSLTPIIANYTVVSGKVGTAFSYTVSATGSPTSFGATGLPTGLSINTTTGVISGTPTTNATSTVTLSATNSFGTGTGTLVIVISPLPLTVASEASATPNPAEIGQSVEFSVTAVTTTSGTLKYTWDFKDGSTGSGSSVTHTYTAAGTYVVTVAITDGTNNATSTVSLQVIDNVRTTMSITKLQIKFNFSPKITKPQDSLSVSGTIVLDNVFNITGMPVKVSVGNGYVTDTLTATGLSKSKAFKLTGKLKKGLLTSTKVSFTLTLSKQSLFAIYGSTFPNATVLKPGTEILIPVKVLLNGLSYEHTPHVMYIAKANVSGTATKKK